MVLFKPLHRRLVLLVCFASLAGLLEGCIGCPDCLEPHEDPPQFIFNFVDTTAEYYPFFVEDIPDIVTNYGPYYVESVYFFHENLDNSIRLPFYEQEYTLSDTLIKHYHYGIYPDDYEEDTIKLLVMFTPDDIDTLLIDKSHRKPIMSLNGIPSVYSSSYHSLFKQKP